MKRSGPLTRLSELLRTGGPRRKVALRRANFRRLSALREEQFGRHAAIVRRLPCAVCRCDLFERYDDDTLGFILVTLAGALATHPPISEPHHATHSRGAGGLARHVAPLCRAHHDEAASIGRHTFAAERCVDLTALADRLWSISPERDR